MIVLALLLLLAAAALVAYILLTGSTATVLLASDELNLSWEPSALLVFLLGALTLLLVVVALGLLRGGTKRQVSKRRELKRLRQVEQETATHDSTTAPAAPSAPARVPTSPGDDRQYPGQEPRQDLRHDTEDDAGRSGSGR